MMANFDEFNTRGVTAEAAMSVALAAERTRDFAPTVGGLTVGLSSGTSGHRGLFLVSPAEQAMWAGVILARALPHPAPGRTRVAFFLRSHSNLYQQVNGALLQLRYFDLMAPLPESIASLNQLPAAHPGRPTLPARLPGRRPGAEATGYSPAAPDLGRRGTGASGRRRASPGPSKRPSTRSTNAPRACWP